MQWRSVHFCWSCVGQKNVSSRIYWLVCLLQEHNKVSADVLYVIYYGDIVSVDGELEVSRISAREN